MKYYVYTHTTLDGKIFYVGKGCGSRAFSHNDRSFEWKQFVKNSDGITIKVDKRFETEDEAFEYEQIKIQECINAGFKLVNLTLGGKGPVGYKQSDELKKRRSITMTGYKYKQVTCPHCKKTGGETSMRRWHFDNCTGLKKHKARVTVDGKRVFLGNYASKEIATQVCINYYNKIGKNLPKEFIRNRL